MNQPSLQVSDFQVLKLKSENFQLPAKIKVMKGSGRFKNKAGK